MHINLGGVRVSFRGCVIIASLYILACLINDLVKINKQKQIILLIIRTTAKKQYKSYFIINCRAINKFINA